MLFDEQSQRSHPCSLLPRCLHNPLLVQLIDQGVTNDMIDLVALQTINAVRMPGHRSATENTSLRDFIYRLVKHVNITVGTLLATMIYYDRLRNKLSTFNGNFQDPRRTRHRLFLATVIVASKYLNDSSPKTNHWMKYAQTFSQICTLEDVNAMERQILQLLDYNLRFDEAEACRFFAPFMAIRAQRVSTRAIAVDQVTKASKARTQAQAEARIQAGTQQDEPVQVYSPQKLPRVDISAPLTAAIRDAAKHASNSCLRGSLIPPVMHRGLSTDSASTSSSDIGSLIDDTGSSSGSSSGWDSESESEEEHHIEPRVHSNSSLDHYPDGHYSNSHMYRGAFVVRPIPCYTQKNTQLQSRSQNRCRKPSDASSVCTVTASSPTNSSSLSSLPSHSRRPSIGNPLAKGDHHLSSSTTMPSIPRAGLSGNFLSRMWGAAKAQAGMHERMSNELDQDLQLPNAFKRLVLVPGRSALSRSTTTSSMHVV